MNCTVISADINQPRIRDNQENLAQTGTTSQPNLASNFQETPLGVGIKTRLFGVRERAQKDWQIKANKNCEVLRKKLEVWAKQVVQTEHPDLDRILGDCVRFKNKIKAVTMEAALRKVDYNIVSDTQDLVYRINKIKKVAEKKERLSLADKRKNVAAGGIAVAGLSPIPRHVSIICSSVGSEGDEDPRLGLNTTWSALS